MINFSWQATITLKNGKEVLLRYPTIEDAEKLMDFINPFVEEDEFLLINEIQSLEQEQKFLEGVVHNLHHNLTIHLVAECENTIVAAGHVLKGRYKSKHVGTLGLSVSKDFRGQGLGQILTEELLRQSKELLGVKMIELTCFANNEKALALYKKLGFREYGRLPKGYKYKNREFIDQVCMYKEL